MTEGCPGRCSTRSATSSRSRTAWGTGRATSTTVAVRRPPLGAFGTPAPSTAAIGPPPTPSVTLVALFAPGVAAVVVAVLLPEPGLVPGHERQPGHPLRALPEVQVRHEQPDRPTVLDRQRAAVEVPDHPGLAPGDVLERQVRGVTGLRRCHHEVRLGGGASRLQERVDADPREPGVELRPGGDAVDGTAGLRRGQPMRLVPGPGGRGLHPAVDGHAPRLRRDPRRGLGREHRPVGTDVVLPGWQAGVALPAAAEESAGSSWHDVASRRLRGTGRGAGTHSNGRQQRRVPLRELDHSAYAWPQPVARPSVVTVVTVTDSGQRRTPKAAKTNSVVKKVVMAVSGIVMLLFLIAHMIGNLHVFQGAASFNDYSHWLREVGEPALPPRTLLTIIEIVLVVSVVAHMWAAISLWRQAKRARPERYVTKKSVAQSYASRTMRWGGVIIALFVVYHILDLTFGAANPAGTDATPYEKLIASFQNPIATTVYVVTLILLGMHLRHGIWSATQTLGQSNRRRGRTGHARAIVFAPLLIAGSLVVPAAVVFGLVD